MPPYGDDAGDIDQMNSSIGNSSSYMMTMPKRDPLYIVVPMTIMYSVIFVTGVIGNSITCMVIAKHKYMHTATNYYLFSLAVSDLILLVSGLPQEMWSIWSKYPYVFGEIFCQLRGLFSEMSANATVLTITAFTAERYVAICHPFMAQSMSKLSRAVKLIVIIWLVAVLFAIPQALQFTVSPLDTPSKDVTCNIITVQLTDDIELSTVSFTLSTVLFFVLPMTLITVLYALIGLRLRRSDKLKRTITVRSSKGEKKISSPEYRANSSSKVLKMLVAVVVAFFICWAPFHAQRLLAIFGSSTFGPDTPLLHQLYGISTYVSGVLYYLSTTINPILYHIMSLKFRSAFKETVLRCCGGGERRGRGGEQRRRGHWRTKHRRRRRRQRRDGSSSAAATADDCDDDGGGYGGGGGDDGDFNGGRGRCQQQKYRRVSAGQTTISSSSVRLPDGDAAGHRVSDRAADAAAADTAFWRRLTAALWRRESDDGSSAASGGENGRGSTTPPAAGRVYNGGGGGGGGGQRCPAVAPMALSNWTVISNSSLKDVDGDDLRDELVGYATDAMTTTTTTTTGGGGGGCDDDDDDPVDIVIADEY